MTETQRSIMQLFVDNNRAISQAEIQEKVPNASYNDTLELLKGGYITYPSKSATTFVKGSKQWT